MALAGCERKVEVIDLYSMSHYGHFLSLRQSSISNHWESLNLMTGQKLEKTKQK